ncbi:MAG TPA: HEAT repeat domain-containing protein [Candidatus Acidoferrales bacterium]|nr:HEAT repeat domain-containing protein [Candidatus Acidoferrales bacterium]
MGDQQPVSSGTVREDPGRPNHTVLLRIRDASLIFLALIFILSVILFWRLKAAWANQDSAAPTQTASLSAAPSRASAPLPDPELQEISRLAPQQQAERLLERAGTRPQESLDWIRQHVDGWRGSLQDKGRLFALVAAALNSDDLRVRAAAVEVDLAANNLSKTPQSVAQLLRRIKTDPASRPWALWRLGALGNCGVEPATVLRNLIAYSRERNAQTRYWAVEGLAMLGTDATLDPLLEILRGDPSPQIRQRAAYALSQAGMLTKEQRLAAVPDLLNSLDDDSVDNTTRSLVYQALRNIAGVALPNDLAAWRAWWANQGRAPNRPQRAGILRASTASSAGASVA